jgi:spermidine/putrescine-binding protein
LETTEKAFNLITNLREVFNSSDYKTKKDILIVIGKRITILNKKLNFEFEDWLVPIEEEYKPLEATYSRLKPEKIDDFMLKNKILEPVRKTWLATVDDVKTRILLINEDIWLATVRNVRTAIMASGENIFIPELPF